jgi:hypothetical protein
MMASQVAVKLSVFFLVARNAKIHLKINSLQPVKDRHVSMAPQAIDLRDHMRLMSEFYEIRHKKYPNPGDGNFLVKVGILFLNLRMQWNHVFVAKETLLDFRKSRMLSPFYIWMAEAAVDLLYPGMYPVAEKDRLDRPQVLFWKEVEKVEECNQEQNGCPEPPCPPYRFFSCRLGAFSHFAGFRGQNLTRNPQVGTSIHTK